MIKMSLDPINRIILVHSLVQVECSGPQQTRPIDAEGALGEFFVQGIGEPEGHFAGLSSDNVLRNLKHGD